MVCYWGDYMSNPVLTPRVINEWSKSVDYINKVESDNFNDKQELYRFLRDEIIRIFKKHLDKNVTVDFKERGALIEVNVPVFIMESVPVTTSLLNDLVMPVCVRYDNDRCLIFELYPSVLSNTLKLEKPDAPELSFNTDLNVENIEGTVNSVLEEEVQVEAS